MLRAEFAETADAGACHFFGSRLCKTLEISFPESRDGSIPQLRYIASTDWRVASSVEVSGAPGVVTAARTEERLDCCAVGWFAYVERVALS
jgi:hypothetical protein